MSFRRSCRPISGRRAWLARELSAEGKAEGMHDEPEIVPEPTFDPELIAARGQGRDGWLREAKRQAAPQANDRLPNPRADALRAR